MNVMSTQQAFRLPPPIVRASAMDVDSRGSENNVGFLPTFPDQSLMSFMTIDGLSPEDQAKMSLAQQMMFVTHQAISSIGKGKYS